MSKIGTILVDAALDIVGGIFFVIVLALVAIPVGIAFTAILMVIPEVVAVIFFHFDFCSGAHVHTLLIITAIVTLVCMPLVPDFVDGL